MTSSSVALADTLLRAFRPEDLPSLVEFWNQAFGDRRGFIPLTESVFRRRILECSAFDPSGLILAWHRSRSEAEAISGLIHAFRPPPDVAPYRRWGRHHTIALLYVSPQHRRQGLGSRLLKAAENWLYYCPVHFAGQSVPCYGNVEGPRSPLFGSTQRMGVNAQDSDLLHFLTIRGYAVVDPGDVSMTAELRNPAGVTSGRSGKGDQALRLVHMDNNMPFPASEPSDRLEYTIWGNNPNRPYAAVLLVDAGATLRGHLCWYPMQRDSSQVRTAAIYGFWLEPALRGMGWGSRLLDSALRQMTVPTRLGDPFHRVEVQTHVVRHADAAALYESRGFTIDDAWVNLVKT